MKNLKPVPADKKKSLGKLPTDVRNKMGYAKKGSMMKARKGGGADMGKKDYKLGLKMQGDYKGKDIKGKAKEFVSTALKQNKGSISKVLKKLAGSQVSDKEAEEIKKLLPSAAKKGKMMDKKNKDKKPGQIFIELKTPSFLKPKEKSMGGEMKKPMKAALGAAALLGVGGSKLKDKMKDMLKKKASVVSPAMQYLGDTAKKSKGGEMKQGYGAARTSGMGLQDEDLIPGKSMDYYEDLM